MTYNEGESNFLHQTLLIQIFAANNIFLIQSTYKC